MNPILSQLRPKALFAIALLTAVLSAQAQKILLDFGPTAVTAPDATLSMGHFAGAVPNTEITWNQILAVDVTSGLVYSDGTSASGVSIILGRSPAGVTNMVDYSLKALINATSLTGTAINKGIYTNTSPMRDGIFANGGAPLTNALGIRVDGLPPGTYSLYMSGRNSNTGQSAPQQYFATNGPNAGTFTFGANTPSLVEANSAAPIGQTPDGNLATTSTFAYGDNCGALQVTIGASESIYIATTGMTTNGSRGFLNAVEIVAGSLVLTNFPATVTTQPANVSAYEGTNVTIANVKYGGLPPLTYQWYHNAALIAGATNATLALTGVTTNDAGNYNVSVANVIATNFSSNAVVTIVPYFDTPQMTNIWSLLPGSRFYLTTTDGGERGLAYNPVTSNLLVVTHIPTNNIIVLDPATGADRYVMNIDNVPATAAGMNMIGVAADGAVYACGVTANSGSPSFPLYITRWTDDGSNTPPSSFVINGDPGVPDTGVGAVSNRWGDSFAVRGGGASTQLLLGSGGGPTGPATNVCLFTTTDGVNFTPNIITVTDPVPSAFAQHGIAFGPGTNTFWAKTVNQALYLVQFDLSTKTGTVIFSSTNNPPNSFRYISTDSANTWMAGVMHVANGLADNVRLYSITNYTNGLVLADQEIYGTNVGNAFLNGVGSGSTVISGNYVFALDMNNGIKAFVINTNTASALSPFSITSIVPTAGPAVVLTWPSVSGHSYQVQSKSALTNSTWLDVGSSIPGTGAPLSATNNAGGSVNLYRVKGL